LAYLCELVDDDSFAADCGALDCLISKTFWVAIIDVFTYRLYFNYYLETVFVLNMDMVLFFCTPTILGT